MRASSGLCLIHPSLCHIRRYTQTGKTLIQKCVNKLFFTYGTLMSPTEDIMLLLNVLLFSKVICFCFLFRSGSWRAHWWTWTTRPSGTITALLNLSTSAWWSPLSCHALGKGVCTLLWQWACTIGNHDLLLRIIWGHYQSPNLNVLFTLFCF